MSKFKYEPAVVNAVYAAVVSLATALGLTIPERVDGWVVALLGFAAVVIPLAQGLLTRAKVTPVAKQL